MMFEGLVQKIAEHPTYGPAVERAVAAQHPLVLNYHTHGPDTGYCISVCALVEPVIRLLGEAELEELAHIRGFGKSEDECRLLTSAFAEAFGARYELAGAPLTYLNGRPFDEGDGATGASGPTSG